VDRRVVLLGLVAAHLVVATVHGTAHALVPVRLTAWGNAVVVATTFVGPVVGVALAWRGHPLGVPVFTASMAGALATGGVLHFLVENPDHVHAIPAGRWQLPFRASAGALAITQAVAVGVGTWYWYLRARLSTAV